ncbi:hypothetical protein CFP56_023055 [Quercus suber]|uniref:Uncharacterized protein n=1 Tax=Quercus suber TaxID=58331 RepID=A0AAW0KAN7_QUESU
MVVRVFATKYNWAKVAQDEAMGEGISGMLEDRVGQVIDVGVRSQEWCTCRMIKNKRMEEATMEAKIGGRSFDGSGWKRFKEDEDVYVENLIHNISWEVQSDVKHHISFKKSSLFNSINLWEKCSYTSPEL